MPQHSIETMLVIPTNKGNNLFDSPAPSKRIGDYRSALQVLYFQWARNAFSFKRVLLVSQVFVCPY
jgi:hypothetical protein